MALIRNGELVDDEFSQAAGEEAIPDGAVIVSLEQWQAQRNALLARSTPLGIVLESNEHPDSIAADLQHFDVVALRFPAFRDGRAYSYARILRERYAYAGELRAVGDVLVDQLHFMMRSGFDAFEIDGEDPLARYRAAAGSFSVWYQPTGDGRATAVDLRQRRSGA